MGYATITPGLAKFCEQARHASCATLASPSAPAPKLAAAAMKRWAAAGAVGSTTIVPPWPSLLAVKAEAR